MNIETAFEDQHPEHWDDYSSLQQTKHLLIQNYLAGWFNIVSANNSKIFYIDTHAGRGRYSTGHFGSPLIALQTLLKHKLSNQILRSCKVIFYFIEADESNYQELRRQLAPIAIPPNVSVETIHQNCYRVLRELIEMIESPKERSYAVEPHRDTIGPAFIFIDPYTFRMPGEVLRGLINQPHVELFVNLMWRELDMQLQQWQEKPGIAENMDVLFAGTEWRTAIIGETQQIRAHQAAELLRKKISARWCTPFFMRHGPEAIRYVLLHFTQNQKGRDLMKDTMWKACPDGGFFVRKTADVSQGLLDLEIEPNLSPVEDWVIDALSKAPRSWNALGYDFLDQSWRNMHLNKAIKKLHSDGRIACRGKFARAANPILSLSSRMG